MMFDAVDPPRAFGEPIDSGCIRRTPEDFVVREVLGFGPSGTGQHLLVQVRKRGVDTQWVARRLAGAAGIAPSAVGYAGLKDRHAVAEQWFSLDLGGVGRTAQIDDLPQSIELLAAHPHDRKLRVGALEANRFEIRVTDMRCADARALERRIRMVQELGAPNYFGVQRFGRSGANLRLAERLLIDGVRAKRRSDRGFAYSAARSFLFNIVLAQRVVEQTWNRLMVGDLANLDGGNAYFAVECIDSDLERRARELRIHPTGPLWGEGKLESEGQPRRIESEACAAHPFATGLEDHGLTPARRPLRLAVRDLEWSIDGGALALSFELRSGAYATSVLREIATIHDASIASG